MAYRLGTEAAVDRLLLTDQPSEAAQIVGWTPPRLPISGGQLMARGVVQGPDVARTLRRIEEAWEDSGFPDGAAFEVIVLAALTND